jgi:hypothetical protein
MAIMVSIRDVKSLEPGVWKARLAPTDLQFLGAVSSRVGPLSVLLLSEGASFDKNSRMLSFNPGTARLLNLGVGGEVIIVESPSSNYPAKGANAALSVKPHEGDTRFLSSLPSALREFGTKLLHAVRQQFLGELRFFPKSGKFVESPDNFWTVRIQARDLSFRITVRGRPERFGKLRSISLKPDMTGYSSFKLSSPDQLDEFIQILKQTPKKN